MKTANDTDMLAIVQATRHLSLQTTTRKLASTVAEVLAGMTGANRAVLVLWDAEQQKWSLPPEAARVPAAALDHVQRTCEPLVVDDALADERFAHDECLKGLQSCSLMVVPVQREMSLRGALVLENRDSPVPVQPAWLRPVTLIADHLAVLLDIAQAFEKLENKVQEQGEQLRDAQVKLVDEGRRAAIAQIATNALHNVGNVLTSVNVSAHLLTETIRASRAERLQDLARLLQGDDGELGKLLQTDEKGRLLPAYVRELSAAVRGEQKLLLAELERLGASVEHVKNVVTMQQSYTGVTGALQTCRISDVLEDALRMDEEALARDQIVVKRNWQVPEPLAIDKTRVMQILVNLFENARQAMREQAGERRMTVDVRKESGSLQVSVADNGCGIQGEHLAKMFSHGFTTKSGGHGFGLHSCAAAAKEMGGSLTVHSDGPGRGATFTLALPLASRGGAAAETTN